MDVLRSSQRLLRPIPRYRGWWSLILQTPDKQANQTHPHANTEPIQSEAKDVKPVKEPPQLSSLPPPTNIVILNGQSIQLPAKPAIPDNCCMSGCAHCVWDMYQEDMEDYQAKRNAIRRRFEAAGCPFPAVLGSSKTASDAEEAQDDMDPSMRAFLKMEAKLRS